MKLKKKHVDNKSGFKNISFHKNSKKWLFQFRINGKNVHVVYSKSLDHIIILRNMFIKYYNKTNGTNFKFED